MELDYPAFAFIISLAAVVNGLGIVRLLTVSAAYLKHRDKMNITSYWVYNLWVALQFLLHILVWWSLWNIRVAEIFNFLNYLYLLTGPILLFLSTSVLLPDEDDAEANLKTHFFSVRTLFFSINSLFWLWTIFLYPVLVGKFAPTAVLLSCFLVLATALRFTANPKVNAVLVIATWMLLIVFVGTFSMELGKVSESL